VDVLSTWLGKGMQASLRLAGRTGGTLPGKVVESVDADYLARQLATLPHGVTVVSGTNGKTTTTKMLAHVLGTRYRVLTNPTGSNFTRGAVSAVVDAARWDGRLDLDVAVLELDEAYAAKFVEQYRPHRVVVLNVLRDQMDRFGEIDHTARLLGRAVQAATGEVVLNRDDPRVAALADLATAPVRWFGVDASLRSLFRSDDELHADEHGAGQQASSDPPTRKVDVELLSYAPEGSRYRIGDQTRDVALRAEGAHNAQNAAAVIAAATGEGLDADSVAAALASVPPAFGRGETVHVDGRDVVLQLAKNPGGFRLALLSQQGSPPDVSVVAINDDYADGRDVSWLWDVDFTSLSATKGPVLTAGTRAADMALRLKYDGVEVAGSVTDVPAALRRAVAEAPPSGRIVIYTTYTAMWRLHELLRDRPEARAARRRRTRGGPARPVEETP
jgi:UDP-N-acetylmuramyl tripeptide synthase